MALVGSLGGKDPLEKEMATRSRKFHGQWSLEGYNPWGRKESDTTERLSAHTQTHTRARAHTHTHTHSHRKYNSTYFLFLDSLLAPVEFLRLRLHMPMLNSGFSAEICQYSTWRSAELCPSLNDLNSIQYGGAHVVTQACGPPC